MLTPILISSDFHPSSHPYSVSSGVHVCWQFYSNQLFVLSARIVFTLSISILFPSEFVSDLTFLERKSHVKLRQLIILPLTVLFIHLAFMKKVRHRDG